MRRQPKNAASVTADQSMVVSNSFMSRGTAQENLSKMADKDPQSCCGCQERWQKDPTQFGPELPLADSRNVYRNEKGRQDKKKSIGGLLD
jgi:hypothetical protein